MRVLVVCVEAGVVVCVEAGGRALGHSSALHSVLEAKSRFLEKKRKLQRL